MDPSILNDEAAKRRDRLVYDRGIKALIALNNYGVNSKDFSEPLLYAVADLLADVLHLAVHREEAFNPQTAVELALHFYRSDLQVPPLEREK